MAKRTATVLLTAALSAGFALAVMAQAPPPKGSRPAPTASVKPAATPVKPKGQPNAAELARRKARFDQLAREREQAEQGAAALVLSPEATRRLGPAPAGARPRLGTQRLVLSSGTDCDDTRADVYPGATEVCDGRDNNCDGRVDEGQTLRFFLDADGDGHGDPQRVVNACPADQSRSRDDGAWLVLVGNDCDDANPDAWRDCP